MCLNTISIPYGLIDAKNVRTACLGSMLLHSSSLAVESIVLDALQFWAGACSEATTDQGRRGPLRESGSSERGEEALGEHGVAQWQGRLWLLELDRSAVR